MDLETLFESLGRVGSRSEMMRFLAEQSEPAEVLLEALVVQIRNPSPMRSPLGLSFLTSL